MKLDQGVIPVVCLHSRKAIVNMESRVHVLVGAFGIRMIWTIHTIIWELTSDIIFFKRMLWSTKSKALRKSTKTVRTAWPVSREVVHKCSAETSACKVDKPARQPNCWWSSWGVTRSSIHFLTKDSKTLAAVGRSEIGRKSLVRSVGVGTFGTGTTSADFQTMGTKFCWIGAL